MTWDLRFRTIQCPGLSDFKYFQIPNPPIQVGNEWGGQGDCILSKIFNSQEPLIPSGQNQLRICCRRQSSGQFLTQMYLVPSCWRIVLIVLFFLGCSEGFSLGFSPRIQSQSSQYCKHFLVNKCGLPPAYRKVQRNRLSMIDRGDSRDEYSDNDRSIPDESEYQGSEPSKTLMRYVPIVTKIISLTLTHGCGHSTAKAEFCVFVLIFDCRAEFDNVYKEDLEVITHTRDKLVSLVQIALLVG